MLRRSHSKLSGSEIKQLQHAFASAYPNRGVLKCFLRTELEVILDQITGTTNLTEIIFDVIDWAESRGRLEELLQKALEDNPENPDLRRFVEQHHNLSQRIPAQILHEKRGQPAKRSARSGLFRNLSSEARLAGILLITLVLLRIVQPRSIPDAFYIAVALPIGSFLWFRQTSIFVTRRFELSHKPNKEAATLFKMGCEDLDKGKNLPPPLNRPALTSARRYFLKAMELDPDYLAPIAPAALCSMHLGHLRRALEEYNQLFQRIQTNYNEDSPEREVTGSIKNQVGAILYKQHKYEDALIAFQEAKRLQPIDLTIDLNLLLAAAHSNQEDQAQRAYERLDSPEGWEILNLLSEEEIMFLKKYVWFQYRRDAFPEGGFSK